MGGAAVADDGSVIKPGISSGEGQCLSETKEAGTYLIYSYHILS